MAEWFDCTIGDLCDTISDTYKGNDNKVVLVNTSDVLEGKVLNHTPVEKTNLKGQFKKTFRKNDILFSEIRPANKRFAFVDFEDTSNYIASTKLMVLRSNDKVIPEFLFAILKSETVLTELQHLAETRSGTFPQITFSSELAPMKIKIPDKPTQRKIVSMLSSIEQKMESNIAINNNLYHLLSLSFKNDYWDRAIDHPEWIMTTLDETTSRFGTGLNPRKNFVLGHGNNYYVTIKNMGNNRIYLDDRCDKIDDEAIRRIQMRSDLKVGDLLFSGIGTIGRVFLIDKPATNWNTSESVFNLHPNAKVSSEFLYLLLLNNDMQDYAISLASGSVQKGIRMADLKKYSFYLPTKEAMERLTSLWKPLIKKIKANEVESDGLAVLRDTILPKLLSGEIDVSDVEF